MCPYLILPPPPPGSKGDDKSLGLGWVHGGGAGVPDTRSVEQSYSSVWKACVCEKGPSIFFLKWMLAQEGVGINGFLSRRRRRQQLHAIEVELTAACHLLLILSSSAMSSTLRVSIKPTPRTAWRPDRLTEWRQLLYFHRFFLTSKLFVENLALGGFI
jgi:hypothetical protein